MNKQVEAMREALDQYENGLISYAELCIIMASLGMEGAQKEHRRLTSEVQECNRNIKLLEGYL